MQNLPIGMQSFQAVREANYLYVDKTKWLHRLVTTNKYYFFSRPRRFGKSLFLSTLKAYFLGQKELFKGLFIESVEKEWKEYPVLYLDLNTGIYDSIEDLKDTFHSQFLKWEKQYNIINQFSSEASRFKNIVETVYEQTGKQVVILVDEYDKPLVATLDNEELHNKFKAILKGVYSVLKADDEYIRFGFLTGVTKFSQVSLFSDLNNLTDISLDREYAGLCGISEDELRDNFDEHLQAFADKEQTTKEDILQQLKAMYDGYHFSEDTSKDMYNPFSLLNALTEKFFRNYWFQTGTPTFLWKLLQMNDYDLKDFSENNIIARDLTSKESMISSSTALFYQAGYLTIKGYNKRSGAYRLGYPNKEVEESFLDYILPKYMTTTENKSFTYIEKLYENLENGKIEDFLENMKVFFSSTPYDLIKDTENHYQTILFIVCKLLGFIVEAEYKIVKGRIDMLVKTDNFVYLFEFKFNKSAQQALEQIDSKEYGLPFQQDERKLYKIGVNFTDEKKNIDEYIIR